MTKRRRPTGELRIDVSQEELLDDLLWPMPRPGFWDLTPATTAEPSEPLVDDAPWRSAA